MKPDNNSVRLPYTFTEDYVLEHAFQDWAIRQQVHKAPGGDYDTLTFVVPFSVTMLAKDAKAKLKDVLERERKGEDQ